MIDKVRMRGNSPAWIAFTAFALTLPCDAQQAVEFAFPQAQSALSKYCLACHNPKAAAGGFNLSRYDSLDRIHEDPRMWTSVLRRVQESEMPPKGAPAPALDEREKLVDWIRQTLHTAACADGISPGPAPVRRLNRNEYTATVRDLLNIQVNAGHALPADGAGGEGFDNAAETLFLSPIHAEKYLEAAKEALEYAAKEPKAHDLIVIAHPDEETTPEQAARTILHEFLLRAFRRPPTPNEIEHYLGLFRNAAARKDPFEDAVFYSLQGVLISPNFLFRLESPNTSADPRPVGDYDLASRLSYFLWGSMPDWELFGLAARGKLHDPAVLKAQVRRMLKDQKTREFAERFTEQWLGIRELGRDIKPDTKFFPAWADTDLQASIRYEPLLFFEEILASDQSLLNLIDSNFTVINKQLQQHYGLELEEKLRQQPRRVDLPEDSHRGGVLSMAAVLAVSSYPQRTSPVLRGKWILGTLLGTPPPPPPPNVPELKEHEGAAPQTLRERLLLHRQNAVCASCHNRIDPMGFGLENYDVLGHWRTEDSGKPIDSSGELPDGTKFEGVQGLKEVLLSRKELFVRNLTSKMLGYALGRGLTVEDYCTVDRIVDQLERNDYRAQTLIEGIVTSVPFRYHPGSDPRRAISALQPEGKEKNTP